MGHPDYSTSLSGALRGGSQFLLCGIMLLGRTREARKGVMRGDWGIGNKFPGMEDEEGDELGTRAETNSSVSTPE